MDSRAIIYARTHRPDEYWLTLADAEQDCGPVAEVIRGGYDGERDVLVMADGRTLVRLRMSERAEILRNW